MTPHPGGGRLPTAEAKNSPLLQQQKKEARAQENATRMRGEPLQKHIQNSNETHKGIVARAWGKQSSGERQGIVLVVSTKREKETNG